MGAFAKSLNHLGRAAVVVDAGLRARNVHATSQEGGDWLRESVVQMTGFGFAGAAGGMTGKAVVTGGSVFAAKAG